MNHEPSPIETEKNRCCTIEDLPPEIMAEVFKYFPTNDRKALKLVCKSWSEVLNQPLFLNDEVLNCFGIYHLSDMYELLDKSKRRSLNLKFDYVKFSDDASFWENNGSRIRSIAFINCQFRHLILGEMIKFCENLFHLSFTYNAVLRQKAEDNPLRDLARVVQNGIVRENLDSLEIDFSKSACFKQDDILSQLFSIFPRVRKLIIIDCIGLHDSLAAVVNNYLMASADIIEKLTFDFGKHIRLSSNTLQCFSDTLNAMNRLTELSINLGCSSEPEVIEKLLFSKPFKSLAYCRILLKPESFLLQLLHSNSNLEHVKIYAYNNFVFTKALFQKLMSVGLQSCRIHVHGSILVEDPDSFGSCFSAENRHPTLPNLLVSVKRRYVRPNTSITSFLQYFQNLHSLHLEIISDTELVSLLKYQTKLKSLVLSQTMRSRQFDFEDQITDFTDAFNQLSDLEHLELCDSLSTNFLKSLSPQSILPKMKYLHLRFELRPNPYDNANNEVIFPDIMKLAKATPSLEALYVIDACGRYSSDVIRLCTKLKRLRYLRWHCDCWLGYDDDTIFSMCPSLRVLHHYNYHEKVTSFLDVINKKVTRVADARNIYTFAKPIIGCYPVDWIDF